MKLFFTVTLGVLLSMTACKSKDQGNNENKKDETKAAQTEIKSAATMDKTALALDNLRKASGLSIEQLTGLLPDTVNKTRQRNYASNSMMGYNSVQAEYQFTKTSSLKITINDCAGEDGARLYENDYLQLLKTSQENETEYTRAIDLVDKRAVEYHNKTLNQTILKYPVNERLLVVLQGINLKPEELRLLANEIAISFPKG